MSYCLRCIQIHIGKFPTCSTFFKFENGVIVTNSTIIDTCAMCRQQREIMSHDRNLCAACLLGSNHTYNYSMNVTSISKNSASHVEVSRSAECIRHCDVGLPSQMYNDFTTWRISRDDIERIPPQLFPESWGLREEWLISIRNQRLGELANNNSSCRVS